MTWDIEKADLDSYLTRIGHPRVTPTAAALRTLHEAHVRAIPFENLDVVLGSHPGIGLDVVAGKLVEVAHHYVSTHPDSPFSHKPVVMRLEQGLSRRLVGDELTVDHADGRTERRTVAPEELEAVLRELDVELTQAELRGVSERKLSPSSAPSRK